MTQRHRILAACLVLAFGALVPAAERPLHGQAGQPPFRVVGYYSLRAATTTDPSEVPLDRLTHVNLWFLNPTPAGEYTQNLGALAPFVAAARARGVRVLASIGGGGDHSYYHALLENGRRASFIDRLVGLIVAHQLDGVDVDLEGKDIGDTYETFVVELGQALRRQGKLMTSAIAVFYKDQLSDRALGQYDFVNIMSYDHTGPWRPDRPGPHSTFEHAVDALEYFGTERKIPKERLVLGVPFYGYGYGPEASSPPLTMTYKDIVAAFPGSELTDEWKMPDGKTIYYNGIPTIQRKTRLAMERASGIMIWQILGDAPHHLSLLTTITDTAHAR